MIPRDIVPYEILQRVGKVAYELRLPSEFSSVHPMFHVSMFKKCIGDRESIIPVEGLGLEENIFYEEFPLTIFDTQVKKLRNKEVAFKKMLWKNHLVE